MECTGSTVPVLISGCEPHPIHSDVPSFMTTQPKEVFLSYGREQEVQAFVLRLKHDLEKNGFSVWLDLEDIPAGKPARRYIRDKVCFHVLPYVYKDTLYQKQQKSSLNNLRLLVDKL